jgi:hypothetical protein
LLPTVSNDKWSQPQSKDYLLTKHVALEAFLQVPVILFVYNREGCSKYAYQVAGTPCTMNQLYEKATSTLPVQPFSIGVHLLTGLTCIIYCIPVL